MRRTLETAIALVLACTLPRVAVAQTPVTFQYFYDELGQLTRVVDSTGIVVEYVYDPAGNLLEVKRSGAAALTVFGLTPAQGRVGTMVEIQGQGFSTAPSTNVVRFNGIVAQIVSTTVNRLVALVPAGAATGPVTVTVASDVATAPGPFTVQAVPTITSITPKAFDRASPPSLIQIRGSNLQGSSFTLVPAFAPAPVTFGIPGTDPTGTEVTLPIAVRSDARGTFVVVATTPVGSSDSFRGAGNTIFVLTSTDELDTDSDGYPDAVEALFGSDPFDPDSLPNANLPSAGSRTATASAFAVVNSAGGFSESTSQTVNAAAFSALNIADISNGQPVSAEANAAFSVLNTAFTSDGPGGNGGSGGGQPVAMEADGVMFSVINQATGGAEIAVQADQRADPPGANDSRPMASTKGKEKQARRKR